MIVDRSPVEEELVGQHTFGLEAGARVAGRMGGMVKIEGTVTAGGVVVPGLTMPPISFDSSVATTIPTVALIGATAPSGMPIPVSGSRSRLEMAGSIV